MTAGNGIAALTVGLYLLAVAVKGNTRPLWALMVGDAGFVKWSIAAALLVWLASRKEIGEVGAGLIMVAVVGMALRIASDPTILDTIAQAWKMIPEPQKATGVTGSTGATGL